ncbi:bacteriocin-like protein [Chryseobacterium sp. JUb7]|uniref:bacteriocin-like protein n=1 Tax=Chryseobacterium sp. JUb7 TaxID=2940599 RepID=UPI00216770F4|nr:hypothetical protein [Chryseobacterium sp. JUb7]MCS3528921.1 phage-related minor tail protein [Chryseobacterium sp. JUb7]
MKNLKKLSRNEMRNIEGNGLLDGLLGGIGNVVGGALGGVGSAVNTALCDLQCTLGNIVHVTLFDSCQSYVCK